MSDLNDFPPEVLRARDFAVAAHGVQEYGSHPYVFHLDQVAEQVASLGPLYSIIAYLHDVLEDTAVLVEELQSKFGAQVARCVSTLSDPENLSRSERKEFVNRQLASIVMGDATWPALVVKVADRTCNISMCLVDKNTSLFARYKAEHSDFRAAAWRPELAHQFDRMEKLFFVAQSAPVTGNPSQLLIDSYVSEYTKNWDAYREAASACAQRCEQLLIEEGIKGLVTHRAKSPAQLATKLLNRNNQRIQPYASFEEISDDIVDLLGIRISLYFPDNVKPLGLSLRRTFKVFGEKVHTGSQSALASQYEFRFSGYWATHYRIHEQVAGQLVIAEIQVASVLMHAFGYVAHNLVYKPYSGDLSETESGLLDQLNGLVIAGEIALEQLNAATRRRKRKQDSGFVDHYELGGWLIRSLRLLGRTPQNLGRVDRLFAFLREVEKSRPSLVSALLLDTTDSQPIADQIVERLLLEHPTRAEQWRSAIVLAGEGNPTENILAISEEAVSSFENLLRAWAQLEKAASFCLTGKKRASFPIGKKRLAQLAFTEENNRKFRWAHKVYKDIACFEESYTFDDQEKATEVVQELTRSVESRN